MSCVWVLLFFLRGDVGRRDIDLIGCSSINSSLMPVNGVHKRCLFSRIRVILQFDKTAMSFQHDLGEGGRRVVPGPWASRG